MQNHTTVHSNGSRAANGEAPINTNPASSDQLDWDALAPRVTEALQQPLDPQLVSQRDGRKGRRFDYIEGHTAIDQANQIFGFGGWGYELVGEVTLRPLERTNSGTGEIIRRAAYCATVRVTVPGAPARTDVGFQPLANDSVEDHETAYKGAVTDALKRALRSFGDRFGNGLYGDSSTAPAAGPATNGRNRRASTAQRQASERNTPAPLPRVVPTSSEPAPSGERDAQNLRAQLIELSVQQGFTEERVRSAVRAKTGRALHELGPAELNPLVASAAEKLEQRRQAELG